jgi:hypothetical protein
MSATKTSKAPIPPMPADEVQVVPGGEAMVMDTGEVMEGVLSYATASGRRLGGPDDPYCYRSVDLTIPQARQDFYHTLWRTQGFEEVRGVICVGLPARVYRAPKAVGRRLAERKAEEASRQRKATGTPGDLRGVQVDYSETTSAAD